MSHAIDGSVPYDLAGRLRSQEETKAWLEEKKRKREDKYRRCTNSNCRYVDYTNACGPGLCCTRCGASTEEA